MDEGEKTRFFQIAGIYLANIYGNPMLFVLTMDWGPAYKNIYCVNAQISSLHLMFTLIRYYCDPSYASSIDH